MLGTHLLTPLHEGRRRRQIVSLRQVFSRHPRGASRKKRRQGGRRSAPSLSLSTKGVCGQWITMWMSDQYHDVPERPAHCPICRQYNPYDFIEMQLFSRNSNGTRAHILHDPKDSLDSSVQKCADQQGRASPHHSRQLIAKSRSRVARQAFGATID